MRVSILPSFLLRSHQKNGRTRAVCQLLAAILDDEKLPPVTYVVGGNECKVSCLAQFFMANSFCLPQIIPKLQQEISESFGRGFLNFTFTQKDCFWRRGTWHCSLIMCCFGQTTKRYASNPDVVLFLPAIFLLDLIWLSFNLKLKVLLIFLDPLYDDSTGRKVQAQNPSFFSKIQLPWDMNGLHLRWLEDSSKCQFTKASLGQFCSFSSWGLLVIQGWLKVNVQLDSCCSKNLWAGGSSLHCRCHICPRRRHWCS